MSNSDICGNPRHAPIAYAYNGVDVRCPLCVLLDEQERMEEWKKRMAVSFLEFTNLVTEEIEEN
jgi:hypothetical protein